MHVRQISRLNKDGTRVRYLQLAHKVRDPDSGRPRDEILCHLGREDQLERAQIERLIGSLARFLPSAQRTAYGVPRVIVRSCGSAVEGMKKAAYPSA
jgi:hypothetical protein